MDNSLLYHQRCLEFKLRELPEVHEEIMSSYVMIAYALQKIQEFEKGCQVFEKALHICRMLHGDFTETTAYSMIQLSDAYQKCDGYIQAVSHLEHACTILTTIETAAKEAERPRVTL